MESHSESSPEGNLLGPGTKSQSGRSPAFGALVLTTTAALSDTYRLVCAMVVFEFLNDVVEIIHAGPGQQVDAQSTKQAGTEGE